MKILILIFAFTLFGSCFAEEDPDQVRVFDRDYYETMLAIKIFCGAKFYSPYDSRVPEAKNGYECRSNNLIYFWETNSPNGREYPPTKVVLNLYSATSYKHYGALCLLGMACISTDAFESIDRTLNSIPKSGPKHPALR